MGVGGVSPTHTCILCMREGKGSDETFYMRRLIWPFTAYHYDLGLGVGTRLVFMLISTRYCLKTRLAAWRFKLVPCYHLIIILDLHI